MKMMLDEANVFPGIQTVAESGLTPLLVYCACGYWQIEGFEVLLRYSASVRESDHDGNTCLKLCLGFIDNPDLHYEALRARDAIIYLIEQGADVFAQNTRSYSVSDVAYQSDKLWGSFRGDLWDCAVANCGYDVSEFRSGRTRQAVYTRRYTRDDFEDLWAGAEHLCPYYDLQEDDIYLSDSSCDEDSDDDLASSDSDSEDGGASL